MMALVADLQHHLVAIEKTPATSAPSPGPQEEMEIVDLPPEAADYFSSEEEVRDGRAQGAPTTSGVHPAIPCFGHSTSEGPNHLDGNLSFIIG